jgi:CheY-like chemotaxis protein
VRARGAGSGGRGERPGGDRAQHPDVALIDIGLPHLNGYDLARRVRQNPQLDDVVLVALTGYGTSADVDEARAAGFDEHITKPCDFDRLNQVLRQRRAAETRLITTPGRRD